MEMGGTRMTSDTIQLGDVAHEKLGNLASQRELARIVLGQLSQREKIQLANEILNQEHKASTNKLNESLLTQEYLEDSELRGFTEGSIVAYRSMLKAFHKHQELEGRDLFEIDKTALLSFLSVLREKGFASNTITNYICMISSFCEFLVFKGIKDSNPVPMFQRRYLRMYKKKRPTLSSQERKLISIEEMAALINSTVDVRNKAIITLLAKTGIRRNELIQIDLDDINWENQCIKLKRHPKRSNTLVFFDDETARVIKAYLRVRVGRARPDENALFVGEGGKRLRRNGIYNMVIQQAVRIRLHDPKSKRVEDHFTPHCCRHWFTTMLARAGIDKDLLKELRGDARSESMDVYRHIDLEELRKAYLAHIPELGV